MQTPLGTAKQTLQQIQKCQSWIGKCSNELLLDGMPAIAALEAYAKDVKTWIAALHPPEI